MDLDELRSVQSRERQTDSLQHLRATFYQDAAEYVRRLEAEREEAAERADDPWNAPEVARINDDIDAAEQTVEAIYERRVGKIVKMASLAAADMPVDDDGLTEEERSLFDSLVAAIEENRRRVVDVLDGEPAAGPADEGDSPPPDPAADAGEATDGTPTDPDSPPGSEPRNSSSGEATPTDDGGSRADAADAMGSGHDASGSGADGPDGPTPDGEGRAAAVADSDEGDSGPGRAAPDDDAGVESSSTDGGSSADSGREAAGAVDRSTVRITADVGEIYGADERAYDLAADDVVTLPEANAGALVDRGAAERLD